MSDGKMDGSIGINNDEAETGLLVELKLGVSPGARAVRCRPLTANAVTAPGRPDILQPAATEPAEIDRAH